MKCAPVVELRQQSERQSEWNAERRARLPQAISSWRTWLHLPTR